MKSKIFRNKYNKCRERNKELRNVIVFIFRETLFHETSNFMNSQIKSDEGTDNTPFYS